MEAELDGDINICTIALGKSKFFTERYMALAESYIYQVIW